MTTSDTTTTSTSDTPSWEHLKQMIAELVQQGRETDRRMQETDQRMQETDRLIRELRDQSKETDRMIRDLRRQLGQLGNRWGEFVQDMVMPAVVRLFQAQGLPVHQVFPNVVARDDTGKLLMEIDLLVVNGEHAIAVECKSRLTSDDVEEHIERLQKFKEALPRYADVTLHGAVAGISVPDNVAHYAERRGLYVLAQADDDVIVKNAVDFVPRAW